MNTITMVIAGLGLLALVYGSARLRGQPFSAFPPAYLVVSCVAAAIKMWIGVTRASYSVAEELPFLVVIFGLPAALGVAVGLRN
ncbi:hypothetical protein MesoLjLc_12600 [Mesorhizobium sp. L-8-10]|uniref:hypothetical protein n=1 Tax=Mesorhizobium sp. L-8-10 TaxID=2744523 RepID=UPI0019253F2A|nr:hypothetical protein [Mesorhizobium sp. L-8-10]BCH29330.1 hypothetical protein MesoLjLc_12600 [Mesorhizobium sp. L-8-10]